jgi:hypothetical protein
VHTTVFTLELGPVHMAGGHTPAAADQPLNTTLKHIATGSLTNKQAFLQPLPYTVRHTHTHTHCTSRLFLRTRKTASVLWALLGKCIRAAGRPSCD